MTSMVHSSREDTLGSSGQGTVKTDGFDSKKLPDTFKVLTLNTWGLKYVSRYREQRLHAIADRLANDAEDYDVVALQEVWVKDDWAYIDRVCAKKYPYRRIFSSGMITGPGLAVLSRYPIRKSQMYSFPVSGRPSAFYRGDWFVGKGASITTIDLPFAGAPPITLVCSHMHAPYARSGDAAYECHRAAQAWDLANIVSDIEKMGNAVILMGDLNSRPGELSYKILTNEGALEDSWVMLHGESDSAEVAQMSPQEQVIKAATTCDSNLNTWREGLPVSVACRLDYMLLAGGYLQTVDAGVVFTEKLPGVGSYSDHFGYTATFQLRQARARPVVDENERTAVYDHLTALIQEYMASTNTAQRFWRLMHFWVSMLLILLFIPGIIFSSYQKPWTSVLFYVVGVLIAVSGVIDGLIGFLFGRHEARGLQEVLYQIDDQRRYLSLAHKGENTA